jgi:hypothetical protein
VLHGCTLHEKGGRHWIGMPARSYVTEAGETSWTQIVEITGGENRARFQALAVAAAFQLLRDAA